MADINVLRSNLIIYEVYYGSSRLMGTSTIDLPELNYLNTEVSGAGIAGDFNMVSPGMLENMELTLHWRTIHDEASRLVGFQSHMLTLRGALNNYETSSGSLFQNSIKIVARGIPQTMTLGKFERASETETESKLNLDYIKIEVGGTELVEYDKFNFVFKVNGIDHMAGVRTRIGR